MMLIMLLGSLLSISTTQASFYWSSSAPVAGKHCVQWLEQADDAGTWSDNFLCTDRDWGMRWNSAVRFNNIYVFAQKHNICYIFL